MFVYIVFDPTSRHFKFGMSRHQDLSRMRAYRTAFAHFDCMTFACSNAQQVEGWLKRELRPHILRHADSGKRSEVVRRGASDRNLFAALAVILSRRAQAEVDGQGDTGAEDAIALADRPADGRQRPTQRTLEAYVSRLGRRPPAKQPPPTVQCMGQLLERHLEPHPGARTRLSLVWDAVRSDPMMLPLAASVRRPSDLARAMRQDGMLVRASTGNTAHVFGFRMRPHARPHKQPPEPMPAEGGWRLRVQERLRQILRLDPEGVVTPGQIRAAAGDIAQEPGLTANRLGREVRSLFDIRSRSIRLPGQPPCRAYQGLRLLLRP